MKIVKRWAVILAGCCVVLIGVILMPVPGPGGTPVTLAGLAILSAELPVARRIREKFLALKASRFDGMTPWKKRVMVTGMCAFYLAASFAGWHFWKMVFSSDAPRA